MNFTTSLGTLGEFSSEFMNILPPLWGVVSQKIYGAVLDAGGSTPDAFRTAAWLLVANTVLSLICALLMKETFVHDEKRGIR